MSESNWKDTADDIRQVKEVSDELTRLRAENERLKTLTSDMRDEIELKQAALNGQTEMSRELKARLDEAVRLLEYVPDKSTGILHFLSTIKGPKP